MNDNASVFMERLKLDSRESKQVIVCPFHVDADASFSVDLDKAVYYCFGGCEEPKGGGAIAFLMRWAKVHEKKEITRDEARRLLRHVRRVPDAQTIRRQMIRDEVELFVEFMRPRLASYALLVDRVIEDINWLHARESISDDEAWDHLALMHHELQWLDYADTTCDVITDATEAVLVECKRRRWWTNEIAGAARAERQWKIKRRTLLNHLWTLRDAIDDNLHDPGLMQKLTARASAHQKIVLSALRFRFISLYDEWCNVGLTQRQSEELKRCLDVVRSRVLMKPQRTPIPIRTAVPR